MERKLFSLLPHRNILQKKNSTPHYVRLKSDYILVYFTYTYLYVRNIHAPLRASIVNFFPTIVLTLYIEMASICTKQLCSNQLNRMFSQVQGEIREINYSICRQTNSECTLHTNTLERSHSWQSTRLMKICAYIRTVYTFYMYVAKYSQFYHVCLFCLYRSWVYNEAFSCCGWRVVFKMFKYI